MKARRAKPVPCPENPDTIREPKHLRECTDLAAMMRRMLRAWSRRVGTEGDVPDLADLMEFRQFLDERIAYAIALNRATENGWTWADIGDAAGTTRSAAHERWSGP